MDLSRFVTNTNGKQLDKNEILDRFAGLIVGGEISPQTRETLLKQLNDEITMPPPPAGQTTVAKAPVNPFESGFQMGLGFGGPAGGGNGQRQQQLAAVNAATINNPVVKMVGLILGSPEFQRQ